MKHFNDSHLEIKKYFKGTLETLPYEAGWADEAIFFVCVEKVNGTPAMKAQVQLSQDGIRWADDGSAPTVIEGVGLHIIKVAPNFGNYIRLHADITGGEMFLNLHIACKG
ncbi:MAG: hypothetical protein Q4E55_01870 [Bacteroidales bacterium]|nr:hypothetical protein [Bacteroidales bacterium]